MIKVSVEEDPDDYELIEDIDDTEVDEKIESIDENYLN